jgi:hypothetical protein
MPGRAERGVPNMVVLMAGRGESRNGKGAARAVMIFFKVTAFDH